MKYRFSKNESGISLMVLVITVILLLILTFTMTISITQYAEEIKMNKFSTDMTTLNEEITQYYSRKKELPIINQFTNTTSFAEVKNVNDGAEYYVIDLDKLNVKLNYGKDYEGITNKEENITDLIDVYIVNKQSHTVYYPKGIEINGKTYYKLVEEFTGVSGHTDVILDPEVTISMQNSEDYLFAIKSIVEIKNVQSDDIDFTKSKYVFTKESSDIADERAYSGGNLTGTTTTIEEPKAPGDWYLHVIVVNKLGKKTIETSNNAVTIAKTAEYDYYEENGQGKEQTAKLFPGTYRLETWGAQGGDTESKATLAYGGYSTGIIKNSINKNLYINVGGKGEDFSLSRITNGGYNGGGNGGVYSTSSDPQGGAGGGGATHIATVSRHFI
ncbi:MAG: hypothetical protein J6M60_03100 [Clostridia bacterium]|nr:hypothetical protein [Clostridia bacterium]